MTSDSKCKVLRNIDAIKSSIFASYEWADEIHRLGFELVFYGIDLVSLTDGLEDRLSGRCTETAYIALDLLHGGPNATILDPNRYSDGYPHLRLLLRCLKPWKWSKEGRHALHLTSCNIELNIGIYCPNPLYLVGTHRLAGTYHKPQAESAVSYENNDSEVSFHCFTSQEFDSGESSRDGQILFMGTIDQRKFIRLFHVTDKQCICDLEKLLGKTEPSDDTTAQDFRTVRSAYSETVFSNHDVVDGAQRAEKSTTKTQPGSQSTPNKAQIPELPDAAHAIAAQDPFSMHFSTLHPGHAATWAAVIQSEVDRETLRTLTDQGREIRKPATPDEQLVETKQREKDVFLAGLGVRSLYFADGKEPGQPNCVILSWTSNVALQINYNKFNKAGIYTELLPCIRLQWHPPLRESPIIVEDIGDYVQDNGGRLTIPILYLRDAKCLPQDAVVEYSYHDDNHFLASKHRYSFTVKGVAITLVELDEQKEPWHSRGKRLPAINDGSD